MRCILTFSPSCLSKKAICNMTILRSILNGITIREELTEEWKTRGVREQLEYAILTAEISKATFGLTPSEYKKIKGLK